MMQKQEREVLLSASQWPRLLIVATAALFLALGSLALLWFFARILAIVLLSASIAAALSPLAERLAQRIPYTLAVILIYVVLLLLLIALLAIIIPAMVGQIGNLSERFIEILAQAEAWIVDQGWIDSDDMFNTLIAQIQNIGTGIIRFPLTLFLAMLDLILVIIISVYMQLEKDAIKQFGLSLFPPSRQQQALDITTEMLHSAGGFVRGLVINIMIIGTVVSIGLSIIGVEFALVLGVFAGMLEIIPVIGPLVAAIPAIAIAFLQSPTTGIITAIFLLVVQQFEGNILTPNIMHAQASVSPLVVLIAVFAGHAVGGVTGALVAVPLVAALRVLIIRVIAPAIRRIGNNTDSAPRTANEG